MRKVLALLAVATVSACVLVSEAKAAPVGLSDLSLAKSTAVTKAYYRGYRRGYYGGRRYGYGYGYRPYGYGYGYRPYGYGYGYRPGVSINIGPGRRWGY